MNASRANHLEQFFGDQSFLLENRSHKTQSFLLHASVAVAGQFLGQRLWLDVLDPSQQSFLISFHKFIRRRLGNGGGRGATWGQRPPRGEKARRLGWRGLSTI